MEKETGRRMVMMAPLMENWIKLSIAKIDARNYYASLL